MSNPHENKNKALVGEAKEAEGAEAVSRLIERNKQSRERSAQILDYYKNGQRKA